MCLFSVCDFKCACIGSYVISIINHVSLFAFYHITVTVRGGPEHYTFIAVTVWRFCGFLHVMIWNLEQQRKIMEPLAPLADIGASSKGRVDFVDKEGSK